MYDENKNLPAKKHSLSLDGRSRLNVDGVLDVRGFDESMIVLKTNQGDLNIRGRELHVDKIDLDSGEIKLKGYIQELSYDEPAKENGLWHRLFG